MVGGQGRRKPKNIKNIERNGQEWKNVILKMKKLKRQGWVVAYLLKVTQLLGIGKTIDSWYTSSI